MANGKLRSVNTSFWSDPFIEGLTPDEKLLFLYLITNEKTNMLGIYEVSLNKISFETGIIKSKITKAFERFEEAQKIRYEDNYVILLNYLKNQKFNTNMKKSAIDAYNDLPKSLINSDIEVSKVNPSEGFETLCKGFGMVRKVEVEDEVEIKEEVEAKVELKKGGCISPKDFDYFWSLYPKKKAKGQALTDWGKLCRKGIAPKLAEIEKAVAEQKDTLQWKKEKGQYIPNASTWLNNSRWLDDPKEMNADYSSKPKKEDTAVDQDDYGL